MRGIPRLLLASTLAASALAAESAPVDIPRLGALVIDGDDADWVGKGLRLANPAEDGFLPSERADFDAEARIGWTDQGLAVLVTVRDDRWVESEQARNAFEGDSVELFLRTENQTVQPVIAPGMAPEHPELRSYVWDYRGPKEAWADAPLSVQAARQRIEGGYRLEALIPWVSLRFAASPGAICEFRLNVNDKDPGGERRQKSWIAADGNAFHRLRLAEEAGATIDGGAWAALDTALTEVAANAVATAAAAGKPLALRQNDVVLASGPLVGDGPRAVGHVAARLAALDPKLPVEILVDGAVTGTTKLPDPAQLARRQLRAPEAAQVFTAMALPTFAFHDARLARLGGVSGVATTWYDAEFHPVSEAVRPGRYGAVVRITYVGGETRTIERTLYRRPDSAELRMPLTPAFAQALGLPPTAAESGDLRRAFGTSWMDRLLGEEGAVALAGLAEATQAPRPEFQSRLWWHGLRKTLGTAARYDAFSFLPKGYDTDPQRRWPAILYLHGIGKYPPLEQRNQNDGLIGYARDQADFPFVVLALQSFGWWESPAIAEFLPRALTEYRIDPDRVYLMGFSMGGYGTWQAVMDYPELFAAGVPMGGGKGHEFEAARVAELPLWVFNGEADYTTTAADACIMADAVRAAGGQLRLTTFPGVDHLGTPAATWATPGLWEWLLQQKRGAPSEPKAK